MPMASSGLRPSARRSSARTPPSLSNSAESTAITRSGTFPHLDLCRCRQRNRLGKRQPLHVRRRCGDAPFLAIERQAHRDAGAGADAAAQRQLSTMQLDQSLDDRETEPRSVVRTVVSGPHLEERIADVAQVVLADADAGIFNREDHLSATDLAAHRDA